MESQLNRVASSIEREKEAAAKKDYDSASDKTKAILKNEELASEARRHGRIDEAAALDVGTQALKEQATGQELSDYRRLSGKDEADKRQREAQEKLNKDLEAQRAQPNANYKTPEQIGRENADRAAAEATERANRDKPTAPVEDKKPAPAEVDRKPGPEAKPQPAPTPSPDVVTAITLLGQKFDQYWG